VLSFGNAIVGPSGRARISVLCNTRLAGRCNGRLFATLTKSSKGSAAKRARRGSASYSIGSMKKKTVVVRLRKSDSKAIAGSSRKQLAKRRLELQATTRIGSNDFRQTSLLVIKRAR